MLSGVVTVLLFLLFIAICAWAWQPRHKADFESTARLAVDDEPSDPTHRERIP